MTSDRTAMRGRVFFLLFSALVVVVSLARADHRPSSRITFRLSSQSTSAPGSSTNSVQAADAVTIVSNGLQSIDGHSRATLYPGARDALSLTVHNSRDTDL